MIKLIVSDMDGTLLNDKKQHDERVYDLLPKLKQKGIRFVVASGRQYPSLRHDFAKHIHEMTIIAENGAFVVQNDTEELYYKGMTHAQIIHCLDAVAKVGGADALVCAKYCGNTQSKYLYDHLTSPKFHYDMEYVPSLYDVTKDVTKVSLIINNKMPTKVYYEKLKPLLTDDMTLVISGENCLDTGLKGVNKGSAVAALQKMWRILPEETLVFGDQWNDVEMFDCAKYSYAMENAADVVKQKANFVAGNNNEGAVVNIIKEYTGL